MSYPPNAVEFLEPPLLFPRVKREKWTQEVLRWVLCREVIQIVAMSSLPIQAPPGGDADRGPALVALFWTESAVAILFIVSRFYARWTIRAVGKDDWMMLFTLVSKHLHP